MAKKPTSSLFDVQVQAYLDASDVVSAVRAVKSAVYGMVKGRARADRTASAAALPEQIGAAAKRHGLMPQNSRVTSPAAAPINNMGENLAGADLADEQTMWSSLSEEDLGEVSLVMTDSGKTKTVMVRRPSKTQACIIDWINFTVLEDTFFKTARQTLVTDDQIIEEASRQFQKIFGFGITEKRDRVYRVARGGAGVIGMHAVSFHDIAAPCCADEAMIRGVATIGVAGPGGCLRPAVAPCRFPAPPTESGARRWPAVPC